MTSRFDMKGITMLKIMVLLVVGIILAGIGHGWAETPVAQSKTPATEPRSGTDKSPVIAARQTDLMPIASANYILFPNDIYKNTDPKNPGPASLDTSRAWSMANEFVYRTALRQLCELPASSTVPDKDGYTVSFQRIGGEGELRVFVITDYKLVRWLGISSKPVTKDGLQVTVTLPKATFAADEPLKFTVEFKNVSDKPFTIYVADWDWESRFLDLKTGGSWRHIHLGDPRAGAPVPTVHALKAGESLLVPVQQKLGAWSNFYFGWAGDQKAGQNPVDHLHPGKYRLTVKITLKGNPTGGKPLEPGDEWTGTIKTEPVEFEITDKAAASQP